MVPDRLRDLPNRGHHTPICLGLVTERRPTRHSGTVETRATRTLVVDDDDFTRFLLTRTLKDLGYGPIHDAPNASDALRLLKAGQVFDVAVLDLDLGRGPHGIDLAHALRKVLPSVAIVLLTSYDDPRLMGTFQGLPTGGVSLSKRAVSDESHLKVTLDLVLAHPCLSTNRATAAAPEGVALSDNQVEIMRLVAEGFSNAEIGRRQHLTERAVAKAVSRLVRQLGLTVGPDDNVRVLIAQHYFARIGSTHSRGS